MTPSWDYWAGFASGMAIAVSIMIVLIVTVDRLFALAGLPTISRRILTASIYAPAVAAILSMLLGFFAGVLIGHLFVPQYLQP